MSQHYIFSEVNHGPSSFLKVAAALLGTGHLLQMGLVIATQVSILLSKVNNEESNFICRPGITIASSCFQILLVILEVSQTAGPTPNETTFLPAAGSFLW